MPNWRLVPAALISVFASQCSVLFFCAPETLLAERRPVKSSPGRPVSQRVSVRTIGVTSVEVSWRKAKGAKQWRVLIDDSPCFVTPLAAVTVSKTSTIFTADDLALVPNTIYHVRLDPPGDQSTFSLAPARQWKDPYIGTAYVAAAWKHAGRDWLSQYGGVEWVASANDWRLTPDWSDAFHPADKAYYVEYAALAALNLYEATRDTAILDEVAKFYTTYAKRFTTLGQSRAADTGKFDLTKLDGRGDSSARTLLTSSPAGGKILLEECDLCTSQLLYPASRLLRMITQVAQSKWTFGMKGFVADYSTLLVRDHLLRNLYAIKHWREPVACLGCSRVELWEALAMAKYASLPASKRAFPDTDLWYGAILAEVLGAHANCPEKVILSSGDFSRLRRAIGANVAFLQSKRTLYTDTEAFSGELVPSASYFNGDSDDLPDNAYSGYAGATPPGPADRIAKPGVSWDVSHIHRLPIYFRALYDNRKATGLDFPARSDIQLIVNQLLYRVLKGSVRLPLLRNYFDGSDGWYRVGYHPGFAGYPPDRYCDSGTRGDCLTAGSIQGWGMLSALSSELSELEYSLISLASSKEDDRVRFKHQHLRYNDLEYSALDAKGNPQYPILLLWVAAGAASVLANSAQR